MDSDPGSNARGGGSNTNRDNPPSDRYAPAEYVPDQTVRQPITNDDWGGTNDDLGDLENAIEEVRQLQADRYDTVVDVLHHTLLDVVADDDDLYSQSLYSIRTMTNAWVYRLVAPSDGYSVVSWKRLN